MRKFKQTGVYTITNKINGHRYVGSAVSFHNRISVHKANLNRGTHHCIHLQNAWNLYGKETFVFELIEECDKEQLVSREQYWLDILFPEYNIRKIAGSNIGIRFSEEAKTKLSESQIRICESLEERQRRSDRAKLQWATPGVMDGVLDRMHMAAKTARIRRKHKIRSDALKRFYATLSIEEKTRRSLIQLAARYNNPKLLET